MKERAMDTNFRRRITGVGGREMYLSQGHRELSSVGAVMLTYQVGEVPVFVM